MSDKRSRHVAKMKQRAVAAAPLNNTNSDVRKSPKRRASGRSKVADAPEPRQLSFDFMSMPEADRADGLERPNFLSDYASFLRCPDYS